MSSNVSNLPKQAPTIISAKDVAGILGIHITTVYEAARTGQIPCLRIGRRYVFTRESIIGCLPGAVIDPQ